MLWIEGVLCLAQVWPASFMCWQGLRGYTTTRCVSFAWQTLLPNRIKVLLLKSVWSLVLPPWPFSLSLSPEMAYHSMAGRIIPPHLPPWSIKSLHFFWRQAGGEKESNWCQTGRLDFSHPQTMCLRKNREQWRGQPFYIICFVLLCFAPVNRNKEGKTNPCMNVVECSTSQCGLF